MSKIWSHISLFFAGVIAGFVVFSKYLDNPDYKYEVTIKKLKSKRNTGKNSGIIPAINIEEVDADTGEKEEKKGILKGLFTNDKKTSTDIRRPSR